MGEMIQLNLKNARGGQGMPEDPSGVGKGYGSVARIL